MATQGVSGMAVAAVAAGVVFVWSGFKGASVTTSLRTLLSGQQPAGTNTAPVTTPTGPPAAATSPGLGGSTSPLANTSPGHTGGTFSNAQLQSLWIMAGGSPSKAGVAACIAEHESSGRASVTSGNPDGGTNVGLWQLDTPGGKGAGYSITQLQDPLTNARVAVRGSSNGTDWSAWSTAASCGV